MRVDDFAFTLPKELIATHPVTPRDSARLLHVCSDELCDLHVKDFPSLLQDGDVLVFNDTKVIPAAISVINGSKYLDINLHQLQDNGTWKAFAKPAKKVSVGDVLDCGEGLSAEVLNKIEGELCLRFNVVGEIFYQLLDKVGRMPLPPYMKRKAETADNDTYQTIYARSKGSVAAPTAGLHFTEALLSQLADKHVQMEHITLHVGAGTFLPVKVDHVDEHVMHEEYGLITKEVAKRLNQAKRDGRRIIAVGTTSLRLLESAADSNGVLQAFDRTTDIFITPGYRFSFVDGLWTNFHLSESTLFMLVSAFMGLPLMQKAYRHAVEKKYRFFSYGDACFLEPKC